MGMTWRKVDEGEWWLLFGDSPDPVMRDGKLHAGAEESGCIHPPDTVAKWSGEGCCLHLYSYVNGAEPNEDPGEDEMYLHICDLDDHIAEMTALRDAMQWTRPEWDQRTA